jgi:hypothetical protein
MVEQTAGLDLRRLLLPENHLQEYEGTGDLDEMEVEESIEAVEETKSASVSKPTSKSETKRPRQTLNELVSRFCCLYICVQLTIS